MSDGEDTVEVCFVEGCERYVQYGFINACTGHYRRYERMVNQWQEDNDRADLPTRTATRLLKELGASGPLRRRLTKNALVCEEPGCSVSAVKRGYCNPHYSRRLRDGTLPEIPRQP